MDRVKKSERGQKKTTVLFVALSAAICLVTIYLFYDFEPVSWALLIGLPFLVSWMKKREEEKRRWNLNVAFLDGLQYMKNSLAAGYSAEGSLCEAAKSLEKLYGAEARITKEFGIMRAQLTMGITFEEVLKGFAERSNVGDISTFAELVTVLKRTGGDVDRVIRQTASNLRDRIELKRDLNMVIAEKLGEFRLMCIIPYGILLYLKICSPTMSEPLYHSPAGCGFMTLILFAYMCCVFGGEWILKNRMEE